VNYYGNKTFDKLMHELLAKKHEEFYYSLSVQHGRKN